MNLIEIKRNLIDAEQGFELLYIGKLLSIADKLTVYWEKIFFFTYLLVILQVTIPPRVVRPRRISAIRFKFPKMMPWYSQPSRLKPRGNDLINQSGNKKVTGKYWLLSVIALELSKVTKAFPWVNKILDYATLKISCFIKLRIKLYKKKIIIYKPLNNNHCRNNVRLFSIKQGKLNLVDLKKKSTYYKNILDNIFWNKYHHIIILTQLIG